MYLRNHSRSSSEVKEGHLVTIQSACFLASDDLTDGVTLLGARGGFPLLGSLTACSFTEGVVRGDEDRSGARSASAFMPQSSRHSSYKGICIASTRDMALLK